MNRTPRELTFSLAAPGSHKNSSSLCREQGRLLTFVQHPLRVVLLISLCAVLALAACESSTGGPAGEVLEAKAPSQPAAAKAEGVKSSEDQGIAGSTVEGKQKGHGGHEESEIGDKKEVSDLDRPASELLSLTCEHSKKTFECDECRYEVGVVKVAPSLIKDNLIRVAQAGRRRAETSIPLTGEVSFDQRLISHLSPQAEGIIRKVHVELGQKVEKGQALFEVDSLELGQAKGDYLEAKAVLRLAKRNHDRQQELKEQKITAEREYLESRQAYETADIQVRAAAERLIRLGLSASEVTSLREGSVGEARGRLVVTAPFAGTVLQLHAVSGEAAKPGESIVQIGDLSKLWIWADLYEKDLAEVEAHRAHGELKAMVTVKAFPNVGFPGTVDLVDATMDEATRTVKVRVSVPNPDRRLRAGMFANVRLVVPTDEEVAAVPKAAVMEDEGRSFVFVHQNGDYYLRRPVTVGREFGDSVEIKAGLTGGEKIVGEGCFLLKSDVLRSKMGAGCAD